MPHHAIRLCLSFAIFLCTVHCDAGTIRDDRPDKLYQDASKNIAWRAVGRSSHYDDGNTPGNCSTTLIAPQWVLGAAHCVLFSKLNPYVSISVGGQVFHVGPEDIFIHPDWVKTNLSVLSGKGDIALYRLPAPAKNGQPIPLFSGTNEVGKVGFIVGFGMTGNGKTGGQKYDGLPRGGQNMIDLAGPTNFNGFTVGNDHILTIDFDSPNSDSSQCGSPHPLHFEYSTSFGDSGGPLLVYSGGRFRVAGITSGGMPKPGKNASSYGELAVFTRVSPHLRWIQRVMKGQEPSISEAFQSGAMTSTQLGNAMAHRRAQELALHRRGVTVLTYVQRQNVATYTPVPQFLEQFNASARRISRRKNILFHSVYFTPAPTTEQPDKHPCKSCGTLTVLESPSKRSVPSVLLKE